MKKIYTLTLIILWILWCVGFSFVRQDPQPWWWALAIIWGFTLLALLWILFKRIRIRRFTFKNIAFISLHGGLFLSMLGLGLSQMALQKLYVKSLSPGETTYMAYNSHYQSFRLPFCIQMDSTWIENYPSGKVKMYGAKIEVCNALGKWHTALLKVNKPLIISEWAIYPYRFSEQGGVPKMQLLAVRDPYVYLSYIGIVLWMIGSLLYIVGVIKRKNV